MNASIPGVMKITFCMGAAGLEWDDDCRITAVTKEAQIAGVKVGWIMYGIQGEQHTTDGQRMAESLSVARGQAGWNTTQARNFTEVTLGERLKEAVQNYPGDASGRIAIVTKSLQKTAALIGRPLEIWFITDSTLFDGDVAANHLDMEHRRGRESDGFIKVANLAGDLYDIRFWLDESLRAFKVRVSAEVHVSLEQISLIDSDGNQLSKCGLHRSDARRLAECGVKDGMQLTLAIAACSTFGSSIEYAADETIVELMKPLQSTVEQLMGSRFDEFTPVSYIAGPRPKLKREHLLMISLMSRPSEETRIILTCVMMMQPLGNENPDDGWNGAVRMVNDSRFCQALADYDVSVLKESENRYIPARQIGRIKDMLNHTSMRGLFRGDPLAKISVGVYCLLRWLFAVLPLGLEVDSALGQWAAEMRSVDHFVKCHIGNDSYLHVCVHPPPRDAISQEAACVLAVQSNKACSEPIEWFLPNCDMTLRTSTSTGQIAYPGGKIRSKPKVWH